jgi:Cep192 domain 4/Beta-propeller repeat
MGSHGRFVLLFVFSLTLPLAAPYSSAQVVKFRGQQPEPPRIVRVPGETRQMAVPMLAERWMETQSIPNQPGASSGKAVRFIGHFRGFREAKEHANRVLLDRLQNRGAQKGIKSGGALKAAVSSLPLAAPSSNLFEGPSESDTPYIPPDPQIAVGPNHIVVAINSLLAIYDKTGSRIGPYQPLSTFFSSLGITGDIFDPRLIYDQADQRFILSAGEIDFTNLTNGHIMLAVSSTSDPTQTWYKFAINSKGRDASNTEDTFPDFPGLGLSSSAVYVTTNQFALTKSCLTTDAEGCYFSDAQLRVIALPELLTGNPTLSITTFKNIRTRNGFTAFSLQPALTYGTSGYEFLVAARFQYYTETALDLFAVPTSGTPTLSTEDLTVPAYTIPPDALQAGSSSAIFTDDFRPWNAVWSNGSLFLGQNVKSNLVAARWYEIHVTDIATASLVQTGSIVGEGEAYYPAISLKSDGTIAVVFTTSSQHSYASAAFTGRTTSDPLGTMRSFAVYRAGTGHYDEPSEENRWGDYSGISEDPDGNSLWGIAEYAGSTNPHFGTAIIQITDPPALSISPASLNFGGVLGATTSSPKSATVKNISASDVTPGTAFIRGPNAADFKIVNNACSGQPLIANQTCTFSVTFSPTSQDIESASAGISYSGQSIATTVTGYGILKAVVVSSVSSLAFPPTTVGAASAPMTVTFTNTGTLATQTPKITIGGPFSQTNTCTVPLVPGASCKTTAVFHPLAGGTAQSGLSFTDIYGNGTGVTLSGVGVTVPALLACPNSLTFSGQKIGTSSSAQSVILTNNGSKTLNIVDISTGGDFSQTNNCPGTLPPQEDCVVNVTFSPTVSGVRPGMLQVTDDASDSPQSVTLSGTATTTILMPPAGFPDLDSTQNQELAQTSAPSPNQSGDPAQPFGRLPLAFEKNNGQFNSQVSFVARSRGRSIAITNRGMVIARARSAATGKSGPVENHGVDSHYSVRATSQTAQETVLVKMTLPGSNPARTAVGADELPGKTNYFFGDDPRLWRRDVPTYAKVKLNEIYPGVDLVYYGNESRLEYDFVVAPGADPKSIRLKFDGQSRLQVEKSSGDLVLNSTAGEIRFHRPLVYQPPARTDSSSSRSRRRTVAGRYVLVASNEVSFRVGRHDPRRELVIDPMITFSTYLAGTHGDSVRGIAIDPSGNIYVTGISYSPDFPVTQGAFQKNCGAVNGECFNPYFSSVFISKLSADGSTVIYSTFLSGGGTNSTSDHGSAGNAIAIDSSGNAYVVGSTTSTNFPVTSGAFQKQCKVSGIACQSAFVTKLNASGSALVYSTYLGGSPTSTFYGYAGDEAKAIAVGKNGNAFVAGATGAINFPTTSGAFEPSLPQANNSGYGIMDTHGFLSEINPTGTALVYSTYLGGTGADAANALALDSSGNVYVAGATQSFDFPTTPKAFQQGPMSGNDEFRSGFITKFDSAGKVVYSSYYYPNHLVNALAVDPAGAAYVAGAYFVSKLHPEGCGLQYEAPLFQNSSPLITVNAIATDSSGNAFLAGYFDTPSASGYPVLHPFQSPFLGNAFVGELNPDGDALFYSTLGGHSFVSDHANALALDAKGNIYVAGETESPDFPAINALQPDCPACGENTDNSPHEQAGFITRLDPGTASGVLLTRSELTFAPVSTTSIYAGQIEAVGLLNNSSSPLNISSVDVIGSDFNVYTGLPNCSGTIAVNAGCVVYVQFKPATAGAKSGTLTITDDGPGSPRVVALNGTGGAPFTLNVTPQFSGDLLVPVSSVKYTVSVPAIAGLSPLPGSVQVRCIRATAACTLDTSTISFNGQTTLTLTPQDGNASFFGDQYHFDLIGTYSSLSVSTSGAFAVEDFGLGLYGTVPTSVKAGQSATYSMDVSPWGGFHFPVSLRCSGVPLRAACTVTPQAVTLNGTDAVPLTVTLSTTAPSAGVPLARRPVPPSFIPLEQPYLWLLVLLILSLALVAARRKPYYARVCLAAVIAILCLWVSCGGGGSGGGGSGGGGGLSGGTPPGSYTLIVTGTYTSGQTTITHDYELHITVI